MSAKALIDRNPAADARARSPQRSTAISAAAARITASCARSRRPPPSCAERAAMNAPLARPARRQPQPRPLGGVSSARQGDDLHRPRRIRPGRAHRHGAGRRRRARCRHRAHRGDIRRHRTDAQRGLHRRQHVDAMRRRRAGAGLRRSARIVPRASRKGHRLPGERAFDRRRQILARRQDRPVRITGRSPPPSILPSRRTAPPSAKPSPN